jgi:hypothetical protein
MAEFLQLQQQAGIMDEQVSIHQFLKGVGNDIAQRAIAQDGIPDKLEKLMETMWKHESDQDLLTQLFKGGTITKTSNPKDPYAMDVDAVRITNSDRERIIKERRCFKCRKFNHRAPNCRSQAWRPGQPWPTPFQLRNAQGQYVPQGPRPLPTPPSTNNVYRPQARIAEMTVEERAKQIKELLEGSEEENEKVKALLLGQGFQ